MSYEVRWEAKGVVVSCAGCLNLSKVSRINTKIFDDPRSNSIEYVIWDVTRTRHFFEGDGGFQYAAMVYRLCSRRLPALKMAFHVSEPPADPELKRYLVETVARVPAWEFRVFDNPDEIRAWTGSEPPRHAIEQTTAAPPERCGG